jgi:hypothetical protein
MNRYFHSSPFSRAFIGSERKQDIQAWKERNPTRCVALLGLLCSVISLIFQLSDSCLYACVDDRLATYRRECEWRARRLSFDATNGDAFFRISFLLAIETKRIKEKKSPLASVLLSNKGDSVTYDENILEDAKEDSLYASTCDCHQRNEDTAHHLVFGEWLIAQLHMSDPRWCETHIAACVRLVASPQLRFISVCRLLMSFAEAW